MTLANEVLEFGSDYIRVPEGELASKPWQWLPYQTEWIGKTFEPGVRRSILSIGRRNGKTATVSLLCCAALIGPLKRPGSLIVSASRSREQASIVFRYAVKMLRLSGLDHLVIIRDSAREIEEPKTGTRYRAISAESSTAHGLGCRLAIVDELGQVRGPRDDLYDALASSLGTWEDSLMVNISTSASTDADLFSILCDDALTGHDPHSVISLHTAPLDADPWLRETWQLANPAMGVFRSESDIAQQAAEAERLPTRENSFRQYILNQRVTSDSPFMSSSVWAQCSADPDDAVFRDSPVYGGLDLSSRQDLTSLALVAEDDEQNLHLKVFTWTPSDTLRDRALRDRADYELWHREGWLRTIQGTSIAYDQLATEIADICSEYDVHSILYDRWRIEELIRQFDLIGLTLPLVPCGQGYKDMSPAVDAFYHAALAGELRHGGNPVLNYCVSSCVVEQDPAGNSKLSKRRSVGRIDCAVATAMACKAARFDAEQSGITEREGLLFV